MPLHGMLPSHAASAHNFWMILIVQFRRIVAYPLASTKIEEDLRRCLLSRFPYGIIYGIDSETVIVIAVAHLHREPRYWIDRLPDSKTKGRK